MTALFHSRSAHSYGMVFLSLFLIFFLSAFRTAAGASGQTATAQLSREASLSDSAPIGQPAFAAQELSAADSLKAVSVPDPEEKKNDSKTAQPVPEGFVLQKLKKAEALSNYCGRDSLCQSIYMKVNRIDRKLVPAGRAVLMPVDLQKAARYIPVPELLTDGRGAREIRVFLSSQYFGAYESGKLVFWGPISSGRKTYPTHPGRFFVNYKQRHKRSIKYDNAPMPFSINYYSGYFMHQQSLPGYPASHGCVRLLMTDAEKLFNWVRVRDAVTIVRD
ncbi:L,D-transpeptidase [Chlorobium sp.]|uniref:L,D-transpeptidase n=1 Tax=Chlorobium sp. TaxID=1095 RepID=UPI002F425016